MVRAEPNHRPTRLAPLTRWSSFGERALLNKQTRFAGVRATSKVLKCLAVDRATFEGALGPLHSLLPKQQYDGDPNAPPPSAAQPMMIGANANRLCFGQRRHGSGGERKLAADVAKALEMKGAQVEGPAVDGALDGAIDHDLGSRPVTARSTVPDDL